MFKRNLRFTFKTGVPKAKRVTPLYILRFQQSDEPKYAVVTGKVVSKKAVERNKVKRMFLDTLKEVLAKQKNDFTLVFFLRAPFHEYKKSGIISELETLLASLNADC